MELRAELVEHCQNYGPPGPVRGAIATIFERFSELGSVRQVWVWMRREVVQFPMPRFAHGEIQWAVPTYHQIHSVLDVVGIFPNDAAISAARTPPPSTSSRRRSPVTIGRKWGQMKPSFPGLAFVTGIEQVCRALGGPFGAPASPGSWKEVGGSVFSRCRQPEGTLGAGPPGRQAPRARSRSQALGPALAKSGARGAGRA